MKPRKADPSIIMKETLKILPKIHSSMDVRRIRECCLTTLAGEIRQVIVDTVSKNGGHLASNLGMAEITLAIHRVFDLPRDSVIFDVSHQSYAHKLLTGRYREFGTLRQTGGLSGFTNRRESEYDTVTAGHSGSAISTAIGIAEANRLKQNGAWTVAVVGDGSFTNGMVYEALNQLASKNLRLIVILNDNEMSISKNVGGLSEYLTYIRTSGWYFDLKYYSKLMMERLPVIGEGLVGAARGAKNIVKRLTGSETWFESFGLEYLGPADGNDIGQMINVLAEAKKKNCPVVVHAQTVKGLGYTPSEEHPEKFHSIGAFSPEKYLIEPASAVPSSEATFTREAGRLLADYAADNTKICAITAAMTEGCGLGEFASRFPDRFFDTGIAEEHAVTMAGGLSIGGMIPVTVLYSTFSQRVFDQMWHDVALQDTKAVFLLSHCGLVPGDGITHQGIYDAALFSSINGVKIYSPDNFADFRDTFARAMADEGISIVRYPKGREAKYPDSVKFTHSASGLYKTTRIGEGSRRFTIITYSRITENCVNAVLSLASAYPDCEFTICSLLQIFPLPDDAAFYSLIDSSDRLLFVEEHIRSGGIGEKLASSAKIRRTIPICAIENPHIPCGDLASISRITGLDSDSIASRIRKELNRAVKYRVEMD